MKDEILVVDNIKVFNKCVISIIDIIAESI